MVASSWGVRAGERSSETQRAFNLLLLLSPWLIPGFGGPEFSNLKDLRNSDVYRRIFSGRIPESLAGRMFSRKLFDLRVFEWQAARRASDSEALIPDFGKFSRTEIH